MRYRYMNRIHTTWHQLLSHEQELYQSLRNVRKVATKVLLPTSSLEVVGLCFSTHSWPPAKAPAPPPKLALPLLLGPADAPDDLAPEKVELHVWKKRKYYAFHQ